jgi:hypothetical protein
MNTIYEAPKRGFSDVLASMPTMAPVRNIQKIGVPEQPTPTHQDSDVLKRQLTANENFWNMVVAESVRRDGTGNPQPEVVASASAKAADAAMRLRLFSAYGTAATEAIAGRKERTGVTPMTRGTSRTTESAVTAPEHSLAA